MQHVCIVCQELFAGNAMLLTMCLLPLLISTVLLRLSADALSLSFFFLLLLTSTGIVVVCCHIVAVCC
jgi:hypothetical protein